MRKWLVYIRALVGWRFGLPLNQSIVLLAARCLGQQGFQAYPRIPWIQRVQNEAQLGGVGWRFWLPLNQSIVMPAATCLGQQGFQAYLRIPWIQRVQNKARLGGVGWRFWLLLNQLCCQHPGAWASKDSRHIL